MDSLTLFVGAKEARKTLGVQWIVERHRQRGHVFLVPDTMGHWLEKRGLYVIHSDDAEEIAQHAIRLTERIQSGLTIVWDEAWKFFNREDPPKKKGALMSLLRTGRQPKAHPPWRRRYPIAKILATHSPKDLIVPVRNLVTRIYVGHLPGHEDREWIEEALQAPGLADELGALPLGKFRAFDR